MATKKKSETKKKGVTIHVRLAKGGAEVEMPVKKAETYLKLGFAKPIE